MYEKRSTKHKTENYVILTKSTNILNKINLDEYALYLITDEVIKMK